MRRGSLIHPRNLNLVLKASAQKRFRRFLAEWQCNQRGTGAAGGQDYLTPAAGHRERAGHRKRMGAAQQRCYLRTSSGDIYCTRSQMMPRGNHQRALVRRVGCCPCRSSRWRGWLRVPFAYPEDPSALIWSAECRSPKHGTCPRILASPCQKRINKMILGARYSLVSPLLGGVGPKVGRYKTRNSPKFSTFCPSSRSLDRGL